MARIQATSTIGPPRSWLHLPKGVATLGFVLAAAAFSAAQVHRWIDGDGAVGMQLVAECVIFASALTGSIAGFAFSAFAGSGLAHVFADPVQSVKVLALCSVAIQTYSVASMWRFVPWRRLAALLAGGVLTAPVAVQWLMNLSPAAFRAGLGVFLMAYGTYMLARRPRPPLRGSPWMDVVVGALGGISAGLAAFPGAFVVPWCSLRGDDKHTARALCQSYILCMQVVVLACMRTHAVAFEPDLSTAAYLACALLAAHLGLAVFRTLTNRQFCLVVHGLLIVSGIALAAKALPV